MHEHSALSVAFVPGVTVTKWARIWAERYPRVRLTVVPTDQQRQVAVVFDGTAQLSFVRLPIDTEGLHVIPLYRERAVAVAAKDHLIAAAEEVTLADVIDDAPHDSDSNHPDSNHTDSDRTDPSQAGRKHGDRSAFDLAAAGGTVLVVPQSIARLHGRKDVVVRPITDAPETQIALVWRANPDSGSDDDGENSNARARLIDDFIGIVRGRTARSSRSDAHNTGSAKKKGRRR